MTYENLSTMTMCIRFKELTTHEHILNAFGGADKLVSIKYGVEFPVLTPRGLVVCQQRQTCLPPIRGNSCLRERLRAVRRVDFKYVATIYV